MHVRLVLVKVLFFTHLGKDSGDRSKLWRPSSADVQLFVNVVSAIHNCHAVSLTAAQTLQEPWPTGRDPVTPSWSKTVEPTQGTHPCSNARCQAGEGIEAGERGYSWLATQGRRQTERVDCAAGPAIGRPAINRACNLIQVN